ncbi:MAG TPA: glycosyltransferase family 4 protein [Chitinophagaceae bacterium]
MKVALIARSTLHKVYGGITVQLVETARHLRQIGVDASICLTNENIDYDQFDLLHFFDITRPANILYHIKRTNKPFVLTPILIDYSEYDKQHRKGLSGFVFRLSGQHQNEYIKAVSRWLLKKDGLQSKNYLWKGQYRSMCHILQQATMILPNSAREYAELSKLYSVNKPFAIIPNGINETIFQPDPSVKKDETLVLCAARIEGLKNQLNLIKALNNTKYRLVIAGEASPNQQAYYRLCRQTAADNISFTGRLSQEELLHYYKSAKVHVLPSWFETCGLSSLEAGAMGCNIVITNKGFTKDYFGNNAFYCDPGNPVSIYEAITKASNAPLQTALQEEVLANYTWQQAAIQTLEAYNKVLSTNRFSKALLHKIHEQ